MTSPLPGASRIVTAAISRGRTFTAAACAYCDVVCVAPTSWRARQMRREHLSRDHRKSGGLS